MLPQGGKCFLCRQPGFFKRKGEQARTAGLAGARPSCWRRPRTGAGEPRPRARGMVCDQRRGYRIKRARIASISLAGVLLVVALGAVPASARSVAGGGHGTPAFPPQFTGLTATAVSSTEVDLSWTKAARISPEGYNVYDGTSPDSVSGPVNDTGLITGTSFQVTGLDPGTTYYFQVTEVVSDPDGGQSESDRSTPAVQATTPTAGPAAPTGLTARVVSSSEVDLSWTAPPVAPPCDGASAGCYNYNVYEGTSPGGESRRDLVTGTTFQVKGLASGTTYYFEVTAVDPAGKESGPSNEAQATTLPSGGGSAAPTGLTARVVSSSEVDLSWTAPGGGAPADGYDVYEGTNPGRESGPVNSALVTGTGFRVTGLHAGTTYYFKVTAIDPAGKESGPTHEAQATTLPSGGGSAAPTGLTARAVSSSEVDLSWTAPGGGAAAGYYVYDGSSSNGESGPVNADPVTSTTFRVTGLNGGTTYYFKVTAVDAGKKSGFSNEAQATTPTLVPAPGPPWGVLGGLAVIVAAIVGVFVWRRLPRHWPPDPVIKAVPHDGPPLAKSIHATGQGPTHIVRIESHPGKSITTTEEVRPR